MSILSNVKRELGIESREDLAAIGNQTENDFCLELSDGREFRFIHTDVIDNIFHEECMESIKDCYELDGIPDFIEIDWKATTDNCLVDGFGHHFSHYDGSEVEIADGARSIQWHVFRTN